MSDRAKFAFLKTVLSATGTNPQEQTSLEDLLFTRLLANGLTIDSTGALLVGTTNGVAFPATQVSQAGVNMLDDYEEGTWTPVATGATVVGTPTYAGSYTKIGRLVFFTMVITSTVSFASTAGVTYFSVPINPDTSSAVGNSAAVSTNNAGSPGSGTGVGLVAAVDNRIYLPTIGASSNIVVSGTYQSAT